jgi:type IV pilus assembly protein PilN
MAMIRINLLPVRQVQKRVAGRQYVVVVVGIALMALIGNGYWYVTMQNTRDLHQRKLEETNARIGQLEKVIGEVNNLNKRKKEVEDKLKVLDDLRKKRGGPVKLLDALATAIPKKVWVSDFDEKALGLKLLGQAESLEDVSDFMRALNAVCWSPKGMGRVVEKKKDGGYRVELVNGNAIEDFENAQVGFFFTNIELKTSAAEQGQQATRTGTSQRNVKFELAINVNYAI